MKKSFIIYMDSLEVLDYLNDDQIAELFKAIRNYHLGVETNLSGLMAAVFLSFKNSFDRDLVKYEKISDRNKDNIGKRWNKDNTRNTTRINNIPNDTKNTTGIFGINNNTRNTDSDSDSDNDTVSDSVNENDNEIKKSSSSAKKPNADFSNESLNFVEWWMQEYQQPHIPVTDSQKNSWRKVYDKIRIRHPKEVIKEAITWAKTDKIWDKNFLSPAKLDKTNPEGIKYIDVFIAQIRIGKKNEIAVAEIDWEKWAKDKQAKKEAEESK